MIFSRPTVFGEISLEPQPAESRQATEIDTLFTLKSLKASGDELCVAQGSEYQTEIES